MKTLNSCPVCQSSSFGRLYRGRTTRLIDDGAACWAVSICKHCSHRFMNPQPGWAELALYYDDKYEPYAPSHGVSSDETTVISNARKTGEYRHVRIAPGMRILDVGCGGGSFLRIARELGAKVQGVEPSAIGCNQSRAHDIPVFLGTMEEYIESDQFQGGFDLLTANHVLEHVPDPVETLKAMSKALATDGKIWLAVPNGACVFARSLQTRWASADLPYHLMHFSPASLAAAAARAGLTAIHQQTYSLPIAVETSIRTWLRYRCFIPQKISKRIPGLNLRFASRFGSYLDRHNCGEAILMELQRQRSGGRCIVK